MNRPKKPPPKPAPISPGATQAPQDESAEDWLIISWYTAAQALQDGLIVRPAERGIPLQDYMRPPYQALLTQEAAAVIEKAADSPTGHSDRAGIAHDLMTMFIAHAKRADRETVNLYPTIKINGRLVDFKASLQPLDPRPTKAGAMMDETPVIVFSYIETRKERTK